MCGIYGYYGFEDPALLGPMDAALAHRGPDDRGDFVDGPVALGHRRLAIIAPENGHQPMHNETGAVTVTYNGMIYNYRELREELAPLGHTFVTPCDTEVLVHGYEQWGVEMLPRLNGQFAFAIWDAQKRRLFLARDRFGIRPLYYWSDGTRFAFASEVKALLTIPDVSRELNPTAVDDFLAFRYVPGPQTMFRAIHKLPPGHTLTVEDGRVSVAPWYTLEHRHDMPRRPEEATDELEALLRDSAAKRLIADVPVGVFLSGGLDSSLLIQLVHDADQGARKTFTIGFGNANDEFPQARRMAERCGTDHHEYQVHTGDFDRLPQIVQALDEPFGDAIVLPTYLLAEMAQEHVKVILLGEGADELGGGYLYQQALLKADRIDRYTPNALHHLAATVIRATPVGLLDQFFNYPASMGVEGRTRMADIFTTMGRWGDAYLNSISLFRTEERTALYAPEFAAAVRDAEPSAAQAGARSLLNAPDRPLTSRLLAQEYANWLPDNILFKQDRLGLAHGLEGRVPFLDHRVVEYVASLPPEFLLTPREDKRILRWIGKRLLPAEQARRKKQAFFIPLDGAYATAMEHYVEQRLTPDRIRSRGLFAPNAVADIRRRAPASALILQKQLMALVMLDLWFDAFVP